MRSLLQHWLQLSSCVRIHVADAPPFPPRAQVSVIPSAAALVIKALKEPVRDRKKDKNIKHSGNLRCGAGLGHDCGLAAGGKRRQQQWQLVRRCLRARRRQLPELAESRASSKRVFWMTQNSMALAVQRAVVAAAAASAPLLRTGALLCGGF